MVRLVSSFLLLSLLIISLMGLLAYRLAQDALKQALFNRLSLAAELKENELNRWVEDQRQRFLFIASLPDVQNSGRLVLAAPGVASDYAAARSTLGDHLNAVVAADENFQELLLLSIEEARVVFSTDPAHLDESYPMDAFFQQGLSGTYIQNVYPSPITLKPTLTISTPVFNPKGSVIGVLVAHLDLQRLDQIILERTGQDASGETYLVDRLNGFVSAERFGRQEYERGVHTEGIDAAIQGLNGQGLYRNYAGTPVVGVYRWLPERELALLAEISQVEAFEPARRLAGTIFTAGLGLAMILAVGIFLLARAVAEPIQQITQAANLVAGGDLKHRLPVPTQDELGVLAQSFNAMTGRLQSAYQQLRSSEEHFRLLIENASDLISIVNPDGILAYVSPAVSHLLGFYPSELVGKDLSEIIHPDDRQRIQDLFSGVLLKQPGISMPIETRLLRQDGSFSDFEMVGNNRLADEAVQGIIFVVREISERKRAENQIRALNAELEERVRERTVELEDANKELEAFAYSVSHDLRAPLRAIDGYSRFLLEDYEQALEEDGRLYLENVRKATGRMAQLIDDLLQLSRVTRAEMRQGKVNLSRLASGKGIEQGAVCSPAEFIERKGRGPQAARKHSIRALDQPAVAIL